MFYNSWTWLIQNLGFEKARTNCCCKKQWKVTRPRLRSERSESPHLALSSSTSLTKKSADPLIPVADLRDQIQKIVVTNPYWEKMNAIDTDGDGDDDADDGDDDEHGNHDARRLDL